MSERDEDQAPESIQGDELEPVSLHDLRNALGPGTTPATSTPRPTSGKTPPAPKVAPAPAKPVQRPLAPKVPVSKGAPHPPPVKVGDPAVVSKSAPKPPRPPRPPLRSVPDTGADMSAKDLEAFAAMSGSSAPPPPPSIPTTPVLAGAASAPPPPLDGALPTRVRHALPKAPPRKALSSQNDEAELARRDAPAPERADDDASWQRPPDSGLTDLRQLASLSNPPDRGSIPDDVLASGALAAPLLPPDLRQLSNEVPLEPPPTSTRSGPPSARKSTKGRRTASGAPARRTTSSAAPAPHSARPAAAPSTAPPAERSRIGLYAIAAIMIVGGGIWLATRDGKPNEAATPSAAPTTTEVAAAPPPTETAAVQPPVEPTPEPAPTTTATPEPTHHANATHADPRLASTEPTPTSTATARPTATAKATSAPAGSGEFDKGAASAALSSAVGTASGCKQPGDPSGVARVQVTFAPSGRVTTANLSGPPFAGTPTGSCIAKAFRTASVPPFAGEPVTVSKTVTIP